MTKPGFIVAVSQKEAEEIAESRPDLIHKSLQAAQDHWRDCRNVGGPVVERYGVYVVNAAIEEPEVKA